MKKCPQCGGKVPNPDAKDCKRCGLQFGEQPQQASAHDDYTGAVLAYDQIAMFDDMPAPADTQPPSVATDKDAVISEDTQPAKSKRKRPAPKTVPETKEKVAFDYEVIYFVLFGWAGVYELRKGNKQTALLYLLFGVIGGVLTSGITSLIAEGFALYSLYHGYFGKKGSDSETSGPNEL